MPHLLQDIPSREVIERLQPDFGNEPQHMQNILADRLAYSYELAGDFGKMVLNSLVGSAPIGYGKEKIVYGADENVVALLTPRYPANSRYDYSIETLRKTFYERKLLHMLMPECIPDIHLISSEPPMMVLDRVELPPPGRYTGEAMRKRNEANGPNTESKLRQLGVNFDAAPGNILLDKDGHEVYVDNLTCEDISAEMIEALIAELPEAERQKGFRYFGRLQSLRNDTGALVD